LFGNWPVHSTPQLLLDLLELRPHAVTPGFPLKLESPAACLSTDEREPQQREGFRDRAGPVAPNGMTVAADGTVVPKVVETGELQKGLRRGLVPIDRHHRLPRARARLRPSHLQLAQQQAAAHDLLISN
jgi:hypothetical protein